MRHAVLSGWIERGMRRAHGMTLFETVVVIFVLSIISVMMFHIMVNTSRENQRLLSRIERSQALHVALESFQRDIGAAFPFSQNDKMLFRIEDRKEGGVDSDVVTMVLPVRGEAGRVTLVERSYYLQREMQGDKVVWLLAWSQDAEIDGVVDRARGHIVTPLAGLQSVSLDVKATGPGQSQWLGEWEPREMMPERVQVRLRAIDPSDPDHPIEVTETLYLMAG